MAEIAGVVLGAVPIVLEALKQYETLYKLCKKFKQCKNGVERLLRRLQVQQVIFQNETELLLKGALGSDKAELMMQDLSHSLWQDSAVEVRIDRFLGKSKLALTTAGQEVADKMRSFARKLDEIRLTNVHGDGRDWKKELKKRFKFAFSESDLNEVADSIASLTAEYRTLRSQLREKAVHEPEPDTDLKSNLLKVQNIVTTRAAAQRVYEVLAVACQLHSKHHAHFNLRPVIGSRGSEPGITFRIAYRHLALDQVKDYRDELWFEVESRIHGTVSHIPRPHSSINFNPSKNEPISSSHVTSQQQVAAEMSIDKSTRPLKKSVTFQSGMHTKLENITQITRSSVLLPSLLPPVIESDTSASSLRDLLQMGNFCEHVRACCHNKDQIGQCIGLLENSAQWQHRLYQSKSPADTSSSSNADTLSALLKPTQRATGWHYGISPIQRLQLAKLLSTAILNFYATPWMQSSWKCDDIFLYGLNHSEFNLLQGEPDAFIEVPVDVHANPVGHTVPDILAPFVRNPTLFSLGVMLIELAFEKPLHEMVNNSDWAHPYATPEYHAAMRLSREVSARMSARYGKIVEQCLLCAFGHGTELENPSLQSAIHKDVVMELDRLSTDFKQLILV